MKYWAYINNEILGPYAKDKLFDIPDFNPTTLICPQTPVGEKTEDWKEAASYPEISAMLNSPKTANLKKEEPVGELQEEKKEEVGIEKEPQIDKTAEKEPETINNAIEKEPHINKADNIENTGNENTEESPSLNQLKPQALSAASPINEEASSSMAPIDNFEVNKLSSIKDEEEKEPEKEEIIAPKEDTPAKEEEKSPENEDSKSMDSSFDPISLSQINRKTLAGMDSQDEVEAIEETPKETPQEKPAIEEPEEITVPPSENTAAPTIADISEPAPAAAPEPTPAPEPAPAAEIQETAPVSKEAESEIYNKLNELADNSISKSDLSSFIEPINNKLSLIDQSMSGLDNAALSREIKEMSGKLKHMEGIIDEIKLNMSIERKPAEANIQKKEDSQRGDVQQGFATMNQPIEKEPAVLKPKESAEDIARALAKEKKANNEIIDEGSSSADKTKKTSPIKALLKPIMIVVLLAAVLVATAIALKQAGIIDLTKVLPLPAALGGGEPQQPEPAKVNPVLEKAISEKQEVKDIQPEIIFFTRTYSNKNGSKTVENQIINTAAKVKGDTNLIEWQATKVSENTYAVHATVPIPSKRSKINYIFEVDYAKKTMKPLNTQAKNVLDNLFEIIKPKKKASPKKRSTRSRKSSKSKRTAKKPVKKIIKPAPKKTVKKAAPIEDEYEYVYEDEEDDSEEDYILPGVPAFGD